MSGFTRQEIEALVNLETQAWDSKNPDMFLSIIHPDMVWPWPPTADAHDPADWVFVMGRFHRERWKRLWQNLFDTHDLIHNNRTIVKILVSAEEDGALAVVDIDTLWQHKETREYAHWKGRVGKIYTKMPNGTWKLISHSGALQYPPGNMPLPPAHSSGS